jgi:signal peptide peptidase SppA
MKTYPHFFHRLFCSPLMLLESFRIALETELLARMGVEHATPAAFPERVEARDSERRPEDPWVGDIYDRFGDIAIVSLKGPIDKHLSSFEKACFGGCDLADVDKALSLAANDPDVERIVLNVNSPGGSVVGVPETADRVSQIKTSKEVHAFVDSMACSAGYYIASQADKLTMAPSAMVGSIGVYMALADRTRELEMKGYRVELIKAGKFKAMGASFKALTDEEREMLQQNVNVLHAEFRAAVRAGRGEVEDAVMEGQWFTGKDALKHNLCDVVTGENLDEYVARLLLA